MTKKKVKTAKELRAELEEAEQKVKNLKEQLKNKQNEEIITSSNNMFEDFKKIASDIQMEDMMAFFKKAVENAKPEDLKKVKDEAAAKVAAEEKAKAEKKADSNQSIATAQETHAVSGENKATNNGFQQGINRN